MTEPTPAPHASHGPHAPTGADDEEHLADWLRLALTEGIGPVGGRRLLSLAGAPSHRTDPACWQALAEASDAGGPSLQRLASLLERPDPQRDEGVAAALAWRCEAPGRRLITLADPDYPARLLQLHDAPLVLYVQGDPALLGRRQVAIVGSRRATALGLATARAFGAALAELGWVVTSGLAEGIDGAGHEGALATTAGATIAVIGTGPDRVYPARHRGLAERIRSRGAVVSEQPVGTRPLAANFPRRNRLIAALAEGVIVVEAAAGSGSLITAQVAVELGREVFAVPGSIHSPQSRGCHRLLRQGATLTETMEDIVSQLPMAPHAPSEGMITVPEGAAAASRTVAGLDSGDRAVLDCLAGGPVDTDRLHATLGGSVGRLLVRLQLLELQGLLGRDGNGDWFCRP